MHCLQTHVDGFLDRLQALVDGCWLVDQWTQLLCDFRREPKLDHWMRFWAAHLFVMLSHHWDHTIDQLLEVFDVLGVLWTDWLFVAKASSLAYSWKFGESRVDIR